MRIVFTRIDLVGVDFVRVDRVGVPLAFHPFLLFLLFFPHLLNSPLFSSCVPPTLKVPSGWMVLTVQLSMRCLINAVSEDGGTVDTGKMWVSFVGQVSGRNL